MKATIQRGKRGKVDLKKLAKSIIGSSKPGGGGWGDVKDPYTYIRKMREEEDALIMKRLDKAWGKKYPLKYST